MELEFNNKVALVTGGTRGIGKQIANDLESLGAQVFSISSENFNLSKGEELNKLMSHIESQPKIDILINNAGVNFNEGIDELSEDNFDNLMQINVKAPFFITKKVSSVMKKNRYGRIINIASIAANRVKRGRSAYSASKASLVAFTKVIAAELAPYGVLCNSVSPGFTLTEMTTKMLSPEEIEKHVAQIPLGRLGDVKDISSAVMYLASDLNNFITGQDLIVDGGFINTVVV